MRIDFTPPGQKKKQVIIKTPDGPKLVEVLPGQTLSCIHEIEHFDAPKADPPGAAKSERKYGLSDEAVARMRELKPDFDEVEWLTRHGRGPHPHGLPSGQDPEFEPLGQQKDKR